MINTSAPSIRHDTPPPPPEQEKAPVTDGDSRSSPTLGQMTDDDDRSPSDAPNGGDEQQTRRGVKRQWRETTSEAKEQEPLESAPPELKRQRTAAVPASEVLKLHDDADLIALIKKHGGQIMDRQGDFIVLTLPPADNLEFKMALTCMKLEMLRDDKFFSDREAFLPHAFGAFVECLEAATLANRADWIRRLLATGMAKNAGELLRHLASRAESLHAHEAVDAITDHCAYWAQGEGAFTTGCPMDVSIRVGDSDRPPEKWQSAVRSDLSRVEIEEIITCFGAGNTSRVIELLFRPEQRPATGQFHLRVHEDGSDLLQAWLIESGATVITLSQAPLDDKLLVIYSTDFNRTALKDKLLELQRADGQDRPDGIFNSALYIAAMWGDLDIFQAVLALEPVELDQHPFAWHALCTAASSGSLEIVRILLAAGIEVNARSNSKETALTRAAAAGRTAICALLLEHGALLDPDSDSDSDSDSDEQGSAPTALFNAAEAGQTATCAFLISRGAGLDLESWNSYPIVIAADKNHQKTFQLLVTAGARLDVRDVDGYPAAYHIASQGNIALYEFIHTKISAADAKKMLLIATNCGQTAMVAHLLKKVFYANDGDALETKNDALLSAIYRGKFQEFELLLSHGATVNILDLGHGENSLSYAVTGGSLPIFQQIYPLFKAASPATRIRALLAAVSSNQLDMVRKFPASDMNPLPLDSTTVNNPLLFVSYSPSTYPQTHWDKHHEILNHLLTTGAPLHHVNAEGQDALILATEKSDAIAIRMLLDCNAPIGQMSTVGKTALHYALSNMIWSESWRRNSEIFRDLGNAALRQGNHSLLFRDLILQEQDRVKREMCTYFYFSMPLTGAPDIPYLLSQEESLTGSVLRTQTISADEFNAQSESQLILSMELHGIPRLLTDLIMRKLRALKEVRVELFGKSEVGTERLFRNALDGFYLTLETERTQLNIQIFTDSRTLLIDEQWKNTLATHTFNWLSQRIEAASLREQTLVAEVFANLHTLCINKALAGKSHTNALALPAIAKGEIASALVAEGIYAILATKIEAAWIRAWQKIAQIAPQKFSEQIAAPTPKPNRESDASALNLLDDAGALPDTADFLDTPAIGNALLSDEESPLVKELLTEFRTALKELVNSPSESGSVLSVTGVSPEAQALYSDLMFRQLHMLAQFIDPEPATD